MAKRQDSNPPTEDLLRAINRGGKGARDQLIAHSCARLHLLARKLLTHDFPGLRRWEDSYDVLQPALLRLWNALEKVQVESSKHFYCLAAQQIRRTLIDLARKHFGPHGVHANHESGILSSDRQRLLSEATSNYLKPESLAEWTEFHEFVGTLPNDEREVFYLLWYQQLDQKQAADLLGVSLKTVKRRWQNAKLLMYDAMSGHRPG